jgi:hypothetical protein
VRSPPSPASQTTGRIALTWPYSAITQVKCNAVITSTPSRPPVSPLCPPSGANPA